MLFLDLRRWSCYFLFGFVYIVDCINGFLYIEPNLHPWNEANLTMVNEGFGEFLDSVGKNFIEYICINIHQWYWSKLLCFGVEYLCGLGIRVIVVSWKKLGLVLLFLFYRKCWEKLVSGLLWRSSNILHWIHLAWAVLGWENFNDLINIF